MEPLKLATAATVKLGPFVDSTDGVTPETGLTIQKADVRLSVNGGNIAAAHADQGGSDAGAPHDELGYYDISLDDTDTATRGRLKIMVQETGALPCWVECEVLDPEVYDALYSTGTLPADLQTIKGQSVVDPGGAVTVPTSIGTSTYAGGAVASVTGAVGSVTAGVTLASGEHTNIAADTQTGLTAQGYTAARAAYLDTLNGLVAAIWNAALSGMSTVGSIGKKLADWVVGKVLDYDTGKDPATQVLATPAQPIATNASGYVTYANAAPPSAADNADAVWDEALAGHAGAGTAGLALSGATAPTASNVADAVWDEALAGHVAAGSAGQALGAAGGAADPLLNAVPGVYAVGTAGYALGNLGKSVWSYLTTAWTVTGSAGKWFVDVLLAAVNSRASSSAPIYIGARSLTSDPMPMVIGEIMPVTASVPTEDGVTFTWQALPTYQRYNPNETTVAASGNATNYDVAAGANPTVWFQWDSAAAAEGVHTFAFTGQVLGSDGKTRTVVCIRKVDLTSPV